MSTQTGIDSFIRPQILEMQAYIPGLQKNNANIIKLNSNENPFPPSPQVIKAIYEALKNQALEKYPEPRSRELRKQIAIKHKVNENMVLVGNGSDEVLSILFRALFTKNDLLLIPDPTYSLYVILANMTGTKTNTIPLKTNWQINFDAMTNETQKNDYKLSIIVNPNAPTGLIEKENDLLSFIQSSKNPVLVDEAYVDFGSISLAPHVGSDNYPMLMTCGTFSKSYSLAGLRVGWLIAPEKTIIQLDKIRDSYNVNLVSQAAALAALLDNQEFEKRIAIIIKTRNYLKQKLEKLGFECLNGRGNFLFCKTPKGTPQNAQSLYKYLATNNVLIRYFKSSRIDEYLRISIGQLDQMKLLIDLCEKWTLENR